MEMVAEKPIGNVSWVLEFSREKLSNMRQQEKAEQLPAGWAPHPVGTPPTGPEPVCCDVVQKPPSLVSMSAWDAVGPGCPGVMVVLGLCLREIVSGLLTLSTFPFTSSRACSLPFTGRVGEAQPLG